MLNLGKISGFSKRSLEAAREALKNSIFSVALREGDRLIGMGRIVGDGGATFIICYIAVEPEYQGRGLGKEIMEAIKNYILEHIDRRSFVGIFADGDARRLYSQFGFEIIDPGLSIGMKFKW